MSGIHIGFEKQQIIIGFVIAQFCDPFCRLPILYLRIEKTGCDQHVCVGFFLYLVVGRITFHVFVGFFVFRISPFIVLIGCERNRWVRHSSKHIDKRYLGYYALEKFGSHIGHATHQQSSGRTAHGKKCIFITVFFFEQEFGTVDKIVKGIELVLHFAIFIPGATQKLTTAYVRNRKGKASVQKAQSGRRKIRVDCYTIGAISIE